MFGRCMSTREPSGFVGACTSEQVRRLPTLQLLASTPIASGAIAPPWLWRRVLSRSWSWSGLVLARHGHSTVSVGWRIGCSCRSKRLRNINGLMWWIQILARVRRAVEVARIALRSQVVALGRPDLAAFLHASGGSSSSPASLTLIPAFLLRLL